MSHTCKNLVIHCIDFRLMDQLFEWLKNKEQVVSTCDEVAIAGAIKDLVHPEHPEHAAFILKQIRISVDLHKIERIILMNHTDCGAYAGDDSKHKEDLERAKAIVSDKWPQLQVDLMLAKINLNGSVEFEKLG